MPSKKTIKRRIKSVTATKQIVKAMDLVAKTKLQKIKAKLDAARPFYRESVRMLGSLMTCEKAMENPLFMPREVRNTAYIVITSDRGLCGSHNSMVSEQAYSHLKGGTTEKLYIIGVKGRDYFRRRGRRIVQTYPEVTDASILEDAIKIRDLLVSLYTSGEADEVYVAYAKFESALSHTPSLERVLPLTAHVENKNMSDEMGFEPEMDPFLEHAVPEYLNAQILGMLLESVSCEQAARVMSMNAATKNASEIIDDLVLLFNRKRQSLITQELTEIVAGASVTK